MTNFERKYLKMTEAKKYTPEELFDQIIDEITENAKSIRSAISGKMSSDTFYRILESDELKAKRYARACEIRADKIAEDALNIADSVDDDIIVLEDGREVINNNVIQRDRLRVDTRKWLLAKLHPKKYGEKLSTDSTVEMTVTSLTPEQRDKRIAELAAKLNK